MGRFSTTVQIKSNIGREQFTDSFCKIMKKRGFVKCSEDEAAFSYALAFSDGWVTVACNNYRDNPKQAQDDVKQFATDMETSGFAMDVIDSDWAIINLFVGADAQDTVIVGRSEFPDEPPKGNPNCWKPLIISGKSWDDLLEIWNKDETFVEDTLCEAAEILGINPQYMVSDFEELESEADKNQELALLCFKKGEGKSTLKAKSKPLTLNAAFKQVFGEALEPLGFVKAKTKYPYYVRLVDNSLIQIIGLKKERNNIFNIIAGIATIYRSEIELNCSPRMNCNWLIGISEIYKRSHPYDYDGEYRKSIMSFGFSKAENRLIIKAFERALSATKEWVLPEFEKTNSLSNVAEYLITFYPMGLDIYGPDVQFRRHICDRDGLFCFELDNPYEVIDKMTETFLKHSLYDRVHNIGAAASDEGYAKLCGDIKQNYKEKKEYIGNILGNKDLYSETMKEIVQRKKRNIEIIRIYGLDI